MGSECPRNNGMPKCGDCRGIKVCKEREGRIFMGYDYSAPKFLDEDILQKIRQNGGIKVIQQVH